MTAARIPAVLMRGGTSKGLFFHRSHLPEDTQRRDRLLLRLLGSPDPYGKQIDGLGGASSSTSKVALIAPSVQPGCDIDYLFGAVSIGAPLIDWSGNCGNLTAAVGPFAIDEGLVAVPPEGVATVRIWQANIGKRIIARVPVREGRAFEDGDFHLDGVAFPSAPISLEFLDPAGSAGVSDTLFPTGQPLDRLCMPGWGDVEATMIHAGNPTVFIDASALGLTGREMQAEVNGDPALLARCEAIRAEAAVRMGLARTVDEATGQRPATPKLAFVAAPQTYVAASGRVVCTDEIDLTARILSMGALHHAMTGTGAVAIAAAAAVPGTIVHRITGMRPHGQVRFGHPSGTIAAAVRSVMENGRWQIESVTMQRSARRLMEGWVRVPAL